MKKDYPTYILCYTLKVPKLNPNEYENTDYWNVYSEVIDGASPKRQAEYDLKRLMENPNLYTWNIARIIKTSEHYKTTKI